MVLFTLELEVDPQDFSAVFKDPLLAGILACWGDSCDAYLAAGGGKYLPLQEAFKQVSRVGDHEVLLSATLTPDRSKYSLHLKSGCSASELRPVVEELRYSDSAHGRGLKVYDTVAPKTPLYIHPGSTDREIREKRLMLANDTVEFTCAPFHSNKAPTNVYGSAPRAVFDRVDFFLRRRDWYQVHGVPHQLGILLSGTSGSGKTSTIKAVANMTNRHIVSVDCKHLVRSDQIKSLFFDEALSLVGDSPRRVAVPERLLVLEEVDQMPCFLKRSFDQWDEPLNNELSISDVLTTLDGAREAPGRMFILTSNHPEVIDPAILRPGRVDVHARFVPADEALIRSIFSGLLDADPSELAVPPEVVDRLPPAAVAQVMLRKAYDEQVDLTQELRRALPDTPPVRPVLGVPMPSGRPTADEPVPLAAARSKKVSR